MRLSLIPLVLFTLGACDLLTGGGGGSSGGGGAGGHNGGGGGGGSTVNNGGGGSVISNGGNDPGYQAGGASGGGTANISASECSGGIDGGPNQDDCVTAEIKCGDTIKSNTIGGFKNRFDSEFYQRNWCIPARTKHDTGAERIYRLKVPDGDHIAVVGLETPCVDLDLGAFPWTQGCPDKNIDQKRCEFTDWETEQKEKLELVTQGATTWYIVVEGKDGNDGPFALSVKCRNALYWPQADQ